MKLFVLLSAALLVHVAMAQDGAQFTPTSLDTALSAKTEGSEADKLAESIRGYFGGREMLLRGAAPKIDELKVAWAIEVPQPPASGPGPRVVADVGFFTLPLIRVGTSAVLRRGRHARAWHRLQLALRSRHGAARRRAAGSLRDAADSREQAGVPKGTVKQMPPWESKIFSGTKRDWWIYIPSQYKPDTPAAVMVFQDGAGAKDFVPVGLRQPDRKRDMPVTVGIFIEPGVLQGDGSANRSFEYDTLSDQYARFLLEEILPEVGEDREAAPRRGQPRDRGREQRRHLCVHRRRGSGPTSSAKCSRGSAASRTSPAARRIREGGHNYPALIRKTPTEADPRLPAGRCERSRQRRRQLAAGQPGDGQVAGVCPL